MRIDAENLVKIYGDRSVVNDVTFHVNKGEVVCLLGPNGAGKTTTFYMVVGLVKPNRGKILLDGKDISSEPMNIRAKLGIGYLPQEASIFRKLSVEDNLKLVLEMNEKLTVNEKRQKLEELLNEFGIEKLRNYAAVSLSGGERRRVELPEHWRQALILCCSMNPLLESILLLLEKLKITSEKFLKIKVSGCLLRTIILKLLYQSLIELM